MIENMAAGNIAIYYGAKGPNKSIVTACASGTHSIGDGFDLIRHGRAKAMIVGGTEASVTQFCINSFANMKALSTRNETPKTASRPFSKDRDGFVMGEGAGVVVLESLEHAQKRGATIYAEIVGYGATADAYHMTAPTPDGSGAGKAILHALDEAQLSPSDVDYINAHGTSTPLNDKSETLAIKYAFGENFKDVLVSSTKSMTGHLLGAAGAIEAIACIKAVGEDFIPPTINVKEQDEACSVNVTAQTGVAKEVNVAISNSLGFGGHNAVLCFKKWKG